MVVLPLYGIPLLLKQHVQNLRVLLDSQLLLDQQMEVVVEGEGFAKLQSRVLAVTSLAS